MPVQASIARERFYQHGGRILSSEPLKVETTSLQWDYAISLPLRVADHAPDVQRLPLDVVVTVTVDAGELGCLIVGADYSTDVGLTAATTGAGHHVVCLTWVRSGEQAHLVFRNDGALNAPCVFTVHGVELVPWLDDPLLPSDGILLPTGPEVLSVHNAARRVAGGQFQSDPNQWAYSASFPLQMPSAPGPELLPVVVVDVVVLDGMIGLGVVDDAFLDYISPEIEAPATGQPTSLELRLDSSPSAAHVMARNTAPYGVTSRFHILGATLQFRPRDDRLLIPVDCPPIESTVRAAPSLSGTFDVLISHTSRQWNAAEANRDYLAERYAKPGRLNERPPFDALPPHTAPYHGRLTVCRMELSSSGVTSRILHHYDSPDKIQHACVVGEEIVMCFDSGLAVFAQRPGPHIEPIPERMERVVDPWLGGLHTVVPTGDGRTCLVSGSGADAILWLDVPRRQVVRRWRLPASRYGVNYPLDETTWLSEHYIPNDLQLGHLNCASPDGKGGVFYSVLGQGDIGRVDQQGHSELLVSGYVGCHGVRFDQDANLLYFCDSCRGRLMRVDGRNRTTTLFDAGSRWLHDAVHLGDGVFLITLGDTNRLALVDTAAGRWLAEWNFAPIDGTLQFLSAYPAASL